MAFFTANKLQRHRIEIDSSAVSAKSPEVQDRLQRIDANYQAFDELFADIQETINNDDRLREFNANLRAADLQPKKKKRWRSRAGKNGAKKKSAAASAKKPTDRRAAVSKIKNAQISLSKPERTTENATAETSGSNKHPRAKSDGDQ